MSGLSPAIAQQLQAVIEAWSLNQAQFSNWLGGVVNGGPNNDGRYPLTNAIGEETMLSCPAVIIDAVTGPAALAEVAKLAAQASATSATSSASASEASKILADAAKTAAVAARNQAQTAQSHSATHEANARYWAELSVGQGGEITLALQTVTELAQQVAADAVAAEADAEDAAQSAALAATFEPSHFDLKSDPIAANRISGTISLANLPIMPGPAHYASSGGFDNLSPLQQASITGGDFVTISDGRRWVYTGAGSKTAEASYIKIADDTPAWSEIADKPTTFLPSAHSHNHTDINGFTWANLGSKPLTFAPSAHGHDWSEITGKPSTFAPSTHGHDWSEISGKPLTFAPSAHGHDWSEISGKPSTFTATAHSHAWVDITSKPTTVSGYGITDLLSSIQTIDGASSGIDADLLDGQQGSYYLSAANLTGTLAAARMPAETGDVTSPAGSTVNTLATVNSNVGSFGSATATPTFSVNAKGLITAAGAVTVTPAWGSVTGKPSVLIADGSEQIVSKVIAYSSTDGFGAGHSSTLEARGNGGGGATSEATMRFHRPGAYGSNFGLGTDNQYRHGGWSEGNQSWRFWTEKNLSMTNSANGNTGVLRDGNGSINMLNAQTTSGAGNGFRMWDGNSAYSIYMSDEGNATWGGNVANASPADYNTYLRMTGAGRGWVFYNGGPKAKIDGNGEATFAGVVRSNSWFYTMGQGLYDANAGQGIRSAGSSGHPYGNLSVYGGGSNGWQGINLRNDGVITWMCNGDNVGMHHSSNSWLINGNMAGDFTFRGNVTAYSDLRLKTDARPIPDVVARRDNLAQAAIMYEREGRTRIGYGAQTVQQGNPEFVHEADDAMKIADGTGTLSVDYGETTAVLAAASKLTDDRVSDLMKIIAGLEARIAQLEKGA